MSQRATVTLTATILPNATPYPTDYRDAEEEIAAGNIRRSMVAATVRSHTNL